MEDLLSKIADTIPGEMITSLRDVYRELDDKQSRFQKDFPVHCIESCGECYSGGGPSCSLCNNKG